MVYMLRKHICLRSMLTYMFRSLRSFGHSKKKAFASKLTNRGNFQIMFEILSYDSGRDVMFLPFNLF